MVPVAAFVKKLFDDFFSKKSLINFAKIWGQLVVEKSLSFFLSFFSKATQIVFENSFFDF